MEINLKEIIDTKVIEILNRNIDGEKITEERQFTEDLSKFGFGSIAFVKFIVELEEEFNCEFPDEKLSLSEMNTAEKIIYTLKESMTKK